MQTQPKDAKKPADIIRHMNEIILSFMKLHLPLSAEQLDRIKTPMDQSNSKDLQKTSLTGGSDWELIDKQEAMDRKTLNDSLPINASAESQKGRPDPLSGELEPSKFVGSAMEDATDVNPAPKGEPWIGIYQNIESPLEVAVQAEELADKTLLYSVSILLWI